MIRKANAVWSGGLKDGNGVVSTQSGALKDARYGFATRFESSPGTNPEELIAAAHAGCFSMSLSGKIGAANLTAQKIQTEAAVTMEKLDAGWTVVAIHLDVTATIPGVDVTVFQKAAEDAKNTCPISRLLAPGAKITMAAKLA